MNISRRSVFGGVIFFTFGIAAVTASDWVLPEQQKTQKQVECVKDPKCADGLAKTDRLVAEDKALFEEFCKQNPFCKERLELSKQHKVTLKALCKDNPQQCAARIETWLNEREAMLSETQRRQFREWCRENSELCAKESAEIKMRYADREVWCQENRQQCAKQKTERRVQATERKDWCKAYPEACAEAVARLDGEARHWNVEARGEKKQTEHQ